MGKYEWNRPPQPQRVGFGDLVGVGIAPVKKTPVKDICQEFPSMHFDQNMDCYETILLSYSQKKLIRNATKRTFDSQN